MTQSSDPKLIEFLTSDQNVGCVLEVLRHGEAIRAELSQRFWSELATHMKSTAPTNVAKELKWESDSSAKGKEARVWLDAQMPNFKDSPQNLFFRIEYWTRPDYFNLYYGLHWKEETQSSSQIFTTAPVQNLRRLLEQEGYELDDPEWWYGWKEVRAFSGLDDFLSFFVENRKNLLQEVSEGFWPFVDLTFDHAEKVNRSLKT